MAHPSVDLVEEDAADLQFPKGNFLAKTTFYPPLAAPEMPDNNCLCSYCCCDLCEPYIECLECREMFCPSCFASGRETQFHKNFHSYEVRRDDFPIFRGSSWTGLEEKTLLDLIRKYGIGNWDDIAGFMENRSSSECREHYFEFYTRGYVGRMSGIDVEPHIREFTPYLGKIECSRLQRFAGKSLNAKSLAGYRAARSDFDYPFDQTAENIISQVDIEPWTKQEDTIAAQELNCCIVRVFNHRLSERHRRYRIIREHGLLDHQSSASRLRSIEEILSVSQKSTAKVANSQRFGTFMKFLNAENFDQLVASLKHSQDLRSYLYRLMELRRLGITSIYGGRLYYKLLESRETRRKTDRGKREILDGPMNTSNQGRKMNPIELVGLPGYEKLTQEERHLCSTLRLEPNAFFVHKDTLTNASSKNGHLLLADARKLLKIDVNKTRKLYDFLLTQGFINKPQS
ncbi:Transcriptional adapter [Sergentomyia squamirostris]